MTFVILAFLLGGALLFFNAVQHPEMSIAQYFQLTVLQGKWTG
jgi:hypothetical protein